MNEIWEQLEAVRTGRWRKGTPTYLGEACLIQRNAGGGAMHMLSMASWRVVMDVIEEQFPGYHFGAPSTFNDHPHTRKDQVEMVLEKAAIRLDEQVAP